MYHVKGQVGVHRRPNILNKAVQHMSQNIAFVKYAHVGKWKQSLKTE